ncbi:MAG: hypothetical protein K2Y21_01600 [Phycisphaerales bacterium]|nr:hypothetical protein [Phycisphaerales bacterium]
MRTEQSFLGAARRFVVIVLSLFLPALAARADCSPQWLPGTGLPGIDGEVYAAVMWDPDGPGPLEAQLTVAGSLRMPNDSSASIAVWTGSQWTAVPGVFNGIVQSLLPLADGQLLAGGNFSSINGVNNLAPIARWNGTTWTSLGTRTSIQIITVLSIVQLPGGDIVAGGTAKSTISNGRGIARWNGTSWSPLGTSGIPGLASVRSLVFLPNGNLVAAGEFATIDGLTVNGVARWNGSAWAALGGGLTGGSGARSATVMSNGDLVIGGDFASAGAPGTAKLARWNGTSWSAIGTPPSFVSVDGAAALPGGKLAISGGSFDRTVALWDGAAWTEIAKPINDYLSNTTRGLTLLPDGRLILFGRLIISATPAVNIASYKDGTWSAFGSGTSGSILAFAKLPDGRLVAGGGFRSIAGVNALGVAVYDGATWSPLGTGVNGTVKSLAVLPDGRLLVGGLFQSAGGVSASSLAVWNGTTWAAFGSGVSGANQTVEALLVAPDNKVYIGGSFNTLGGVAAANIGSWNGSSFAPLNTGLNSNVRALAWHAGKLTAGGDFTDPLGIGRERIAAWNGSTWTSLGFGLGASINGVSEVGCLLPLPDGTLLVGGLFSQATVSNGLGLWNGTSWSNVWTATSSVTIPSVWSLTRLANGDVLAGGFLTTVNGVTVNSIVRRDHVSGTWAPLGTGPAVGVGVDGGSIINAIIEFGSGFFAAGGFNTAGGQPSAALAYFADSVSPVVAHSPAPVNDEKGATIQLSALLAPGYPGGSYAWLRETAPLSGVFAPIANGPGGASSGGGTVTGASGSLPSPSTNTPIVLTISNTRPSDSARYRFEATNACGSTQSAPAQVTIVDNCPSDLNADGMVDDSDFSLFAAAYNILDCSDPSMPAGCPADLNFDGFVDDADFSLFAVAYDLLLCP